MSISYEFCISTDAKPELVLQLFLDSLGLVPDHFSDTGLPIGGRGHGFDMAAGSLTALRLEIFQEELGISPTVQFDFWEDPEAGCSRYSAVTAMLRGVFAVMHQYAGDAAMIFNGDIVMLLRKAGRLFLSGDWWDQERLALVEGPYELKEIPHF